jgi:hypothetical protein
MGHWSDSRPHVVMEREWTLGASKKMDIKAHYNAVWLDFFRRAGAVKLNGREVRH